MVARMWLCCCVQREREKCHWQWLLLLFRNFYMNLSASGLLYFVPQQARLSASGPFCSHYWMNISKSFTWSGRETNREAWSSHTWKGDFPGVTVEVFKIFLHSDALGPKELCAVDNQPGSRDNNHLWTLYGKITTLENGREEKRWQWR